MNDWPPQRIRNLLELLGKKPHEFADMMGVDRTTVFGWLAVDVQGNQKSRPPGPAQKFMAFMETNPKKFSREPMLAG